MVSTTRKGSSSRSRSSAVRTVSGTVIEFLHGQIHGAPFVCLYARIRPIITGTDEAIPSEEISGYINIALIGRNIIQLYRNVLVCRIRVASCTRIRVKIQRLPSSLSFPTHVRALLFRRGDIAFTVSGEPVSLNNKTEDEIFNFITKKQYVEKLLMEERVRVSDREKKAVRSVMKELFRTTVLPDDEDAIMRDFRSFAKSLIADIEKLEPLYERYAYPGKEVLARGKALLRTALQPQSAAEFFADIAKKQDDYLDFAEDYEPVKAFFGGDQKIIFTRALDMLAIYDDSKTYIVNAELEEVVAQMRAVVRQDKPYASIPRLPELRDKFTDLYNAVLEEESVPVLSSIEGDLVRVLQVLQGKPYAAQYEANYRAQFAEIKSGAERCNNVSQLRSYKDKAEALKLRLLNEMDARDASLAAQKETEQEAHEEAPPAPQKVRKIKNVSIKKVTGTSSWRIESKEDIEHCVKEMREALLAQLDEDTIVNIEF